MKTVIDLLREIQTEIYDTAYECCEGTPHYFDKLIKSADGIGEVMDILQAGGYDTAYEMRENIRKEIEGRFISGSIKRSGRIGANGSPLEVGRRKLRGVEYKVFVTVIPVDEDKAHNEEAVE
jgi:hypothetical protein